MLSAAKHLLFLVENKQKQIPRSARDDAGALFISLLRLASLYSMRIATRCLNHKTTR
jgi:hypothetical protein